MLSKKVLKDIQSLGRKKQREETGLFVAEGPKIAAELLVTIPSEVVGVYAEEGWINNNQELLQNITVTPVTPAELEKMSNLQTPHEVLLTVNQLPSSEPVLAKEFCLYLDAIQDPGNFGTIVRIADWFGIGHVVCSPGCADLYNPKVVQSTMASIARVNVWTDAKGEWLKKQTVPIIAAALDGENLYQYGQITSGVLLIGNESKGLSPSLLAQCTQRLTIPKIGEAESLNAAVATGIMLSHLLC